MTKSQKLIIGLVLSCLHLLTSADVLFGRVVGVSDGDTITVLGESKTKFVIRLMGIDAPEKAQAFGQESKQSLTELIYDRDVEVTWFKRDRYGRTVGLVRVNGVDVCLEQIKSGFAWHYKQYEREQTTEDRVSYAEAERVARSARLGLWSEDSPIEPAQFRGNKSRTIFLGE